MITLIYSNRSPQAAKSIGNDFDPELRSVLHKLWQITFDVTAGLSEPGKALKDFLNGLSFGPNMNTGWYHNRTFHLLDHTLMYAHCDEDQSDEMIDNILSFSVADDNIPDTWHSPRFAAAGRSLTLRVNEGHCYCLTTLTVRRRLQPDTEQEDHSGKSKADGNNENGDHNENENVDDENENENDDHGTKPPAPPAPTAPPVTTPALLNPLTSDNNRKRGSKIKSPSKVPSSPPHHRSYRYSTVMNDREMKVLPILPTGALEFSTNIRLNWVDINVIKVCPDTLHLI